MRAIAVLALGAAPLAAEWNFGAYLGAAHTLNSSLDIAGLHFNDVAFEGRSFEPPLYYGYRAGYFFSRHFGLEAEFTHAKVYAKLESPAVSRFSLSHGFNLLLGNFVLRQPLRRRAVILTARLGAGGTIPHVESTVLGQSDEHYQWASPAIQLAGGAEVRLWRGLYATGEYKFTRTDEHVRAVSGPAQTLLRTHHVAFGVSYHLR